MVYEQEVPKKAFGDVNWKREGLVFYGCGGDLREWVNGLGGVMETAGVVAAPALERFDVASICSVQTTGGRTDLVMPFGEGEGIDIGRMAMWRLAFGDCSWMSDYVVNYRSQHGEAELEGDELGFDDDADELEDDEYEVGEDSEARYPQVRVRLVGADGNAFAVIGRVTQALRDGLKEAGMEHRAIMSEVSAFQKEATSGDYDHLLATAMRWVTVD